MTHEEYRSEMEFLRLKQSETHGGLRGHVWFMLLCHEGGAPITDRQWERLREYYEADTAACKATMDHAFSNAAAFQ